MTVLSEENRNGTARILVWTVISLLAGAASALVVGVYFMPRFGAATETLLPFVAVRGRDFVIDPGAFSHRAARSTVSIARAAELGEVAGGRALAADALRGRAIFLTQDGWLVGAFKDAGRDLAALTSDGLLLPLAARVADEGTGLMFARVQSSDAAAVPLGNSAELRVGDSVFIVPARGTVIVRRIAALRALPSFGARDLVESSDELSRRIVLDAPAPAFAPGMPLWNQRGEVVGILLGAETAVPVSALRPVMEKIFKGEKPTRPALGILGVDLTSLAVPPPEFAGKRGVLVTAVTSRAPAANAGIKAGDLITAVGEDQLDGTRNLFEILLGYELGSIVSVSYQRKGASLTALVTLGPLGI